MTDSSKLRSKFESLGREINVDVWKHHALYVNNLVGDIQAVPRDFYRYINGKKKDAKGIPPLKKRSRSGVAQSDLEKAEEFNGQFTDVFNKDEHSHIPLLDRSAPFMDNNCVSKEGVTKLLKGLNPSKALGPDEIHPRVFKELATELGPVFAHLFQQSIDTGEIPKEQSLANTCPLFKKNDRTLAKDFYGLNTINYRPDLRKMHSCETHLTMVINDWAKILDNKGQVDTFILDFEKPFETHPQELLMRGLTTWLLFVMLIVFLVLDCIVS